jgi:hypothetical protein
LNGVVSGAFFWKKGKILEKSLEQWRMVGRGEFAFLRAVVKHGSG